MNKKLCEDYEVKGLVADSQKIRLELMKKIDDGEMTLEQVQNKIKELKNNAHKKGLYTREDFYKKELPDFENIKKKIIEKSLVKLKRKIKISNSKTKKISKI